MDVLDAAWIVLSALIVLDMQCGFLCLEAGAVRRKNAANVAIKNLSDICFVAIAYWLVGYGLMYGDSVAGLVGSSGFAINFSAPSIEEPFESAFFVFQLAFASTAATIVSGAVAERERYAGYICLSVAMGGLVYPLAGHWVWHEAGWLAQAGFIDFAGATVVHILGGTAALTAVIIIGPRLGRGGRKRRQFEEDNIAIMALGGLMLWIGWGAFNGGSALVFDAAVPGVVVGTMLAAGGGGIASVALSQIVRRHLRADYLINGVLAGLVASTGAVHLFSSLDALIVGALGACAMVAVRESLERTRADDVVGAVAVHLGAGVIGALAVPVFADADALPLGEFWPQMGIQAVGIAAVIFLTGVVIGATALMARTAGILRARARDEVRGLNLSENSHTSAFDELLREMKRHQKTGAFWRRVKIERATEAGVVALRYNRVLDRVEAEIDRRMDAVRNERAMRTMAEDAFQAMRKAQEESAWAARHDALTGLGNRAFFDDMCIPVPEGVDTAGMLVLAIDLDRFKHVNDTYGHNAGDAVLVEVADRIRAITTEGRDLAFRIGGDEFVVLLEFKGDDLAAQALCDGLVRTLTLPVAHRALQLMFGASIGWSRSDTDEDLAETLHRADLALYKAKEGGRNLAVAYEPAFKDAHSRHIALLEDFRAALAGGEIRVAFQPLIDARTGALAGCEALARWTQPRHGPVGPAEFVRLADELRLTEALDRHVLDVALAGWWRLKEEGLPLARVSVNVSGRRLADPNLMEEMRRRTDLPPPGHLTFEILETAFLDSADAGVQYRLDALRELGVRIAVDDFGTGHASLASVLDLKPETLKIDRMFASGVEADTARQDLMRALIGIGERVQAEVVVEGVETAEAAMVLEEMGADLLQGYGFARPMPITEFIDWAKQMSEKAA